MVESNLNASRAEMTAPDAAFLSPIMRLDAGVSSKDEFIDAMRGFAALLVAYFHCRQVAWIGLRHFHQLFGFSLHPGVIAGYMTAPMYGGAAGVSIFFVISGYCIHRHAAMRLAADPNYRLDSRLFWARRFVRIYPVLFAALLLTLGLDLVSLHFPPVSQKIRDIGVQAFLVNLFSLQGVAGYAYGSNGALWTLSLEVQLYAVYPLLLALRRRIGLGATMGVIAVVSVMSAWWLERHDVQFFSSYWLMWALGVYLAEVHARPSAFALTTRQAALWRAAAVLFGILGCAVVHLGEYGALQSWALGFACYMRTVFARDRSYAPHNFVVRAFARCGAFSYSLYIVHLPVFVCLQSVLFRSALQTSIWPSFAFMPVAVLVAYGLYRSVELPAMRWSARMKSSDVAPPYVHCDVVGTIEHR
jgi:peptidoglycan/LPS O-acetylase OafA/YrhL